jgi:hypothetical protein
LRLYHKAISGEEYTQLAGLFDPFYALKMNKNPAQFGYIHFWKSPKRLNVKLKASIA